MQHVQGTQSSTTRCFYGCHGVHLISVVALDLRRIAMTWTTPTLVEICIGLEINGYLPAEF